MIDILPKEMRERFGTLVPLWREGTAEDVANLVLVLASDDSSYCTGAEFIVDGDLTAM
jgi:3alpha(or 20beta)-hydroxysteroid dehydrogenase